jgi:ribosome biogenesis ATPase
LIDDAMLRPGRLGKLLYVPLPSAADRVSILKAVTKKISLSNRSETEKGFVNIESIGFDSRLDGFSGADLAALVREAGLEVIREITDKSNMPSAVLETNECAILDESELIIRSHHFEAALKRVKPSVSLQDRQRFY